MESKCYHEKVVPIQQNGIRHAFCIKCQKILWSVRIEQGDLSL